MPQLANYSLVEGDWKDFRFRKIQPEDYNNVCEHVAENFVRDEPTSKLLGYSREFAEDFNKAVRKVLPDGMSFLAEDRATGEIAAVRISFHHNEKTNFDDLVVNSRQAQLLFKVIEELETKSDFAKRYGVKDWVEFFIVSTNPKYRNQGLAGEFYTRSLAFFKAEGFKHALVITTSPYTKAATRKRGFEEVSRLDYDKFVDFEGKLVFDKEQLTSDHFALCMVKTIE